MHLNVNETIAAIASAPGNALRGIIRLSGDATQDQLLKSFEFQNQEFVSRQLLAADDAIRIDAPIRLEQELDLDLQVLFWPDKRSYTRQPSAELHCIGAPCILQLLLEKLFESGCRAAEPGEFTLRAFLAGRIDLTQAEAVLGIIDARNRRQFDTAFEQLAGGIGGPVARSRDQLISILAELEAGLDFVEEDIEFISPGQLHLQLTAACESLDQLLTQIQERHIESDLPRVVLVGKPNVGKSSLFNKLTSGKSLVSNQQGTTRDYVTATVEVNGRKFELVDTAGLDTLNESSVIDQLMCGQTQSAMDFADMLILCLESGTDPNTWEQEILESANCPLVVAWTKCDLEFDPAIGSGVQTSAVRAMGISELREQITAASSQLNCDANQNSATVIRTRECIVQAANSLQIAQTSALAGTSEELIAAEIRNALDYLGRVVGKIYTDEILDQVFSRFCIGK